MSWEGSLYLYFFLHQHYHQSELMIPRRRKVVKKDEGGRDTPK